MTSMKRSDPGFCVLIVFSAVVFITMIGMNALAGNPAISRGLFLHGIGNVSAIYELDITPAGWTFAIWGVIYIFQAVWIMYAVSNICRSKPGGPAYNSPTLLTPVFFIVYILNNVSNIIWLFVWDREYITVAAPLLGVTAVTLYINLGLAYGQLAYYREQLKQEGRSKEITFFTIFVCNGLGLYAAWTTIATVLNIGSVLAYALTPPIQQETTCLICLSTISLLYLGYIILDLTALDAYSRFTFSPYPLLLWALAGVLSKNWDPTKTSSIFVAILAGNAVVGLVLKIVVSVLRQKQQPLKYKVLG